MRRRFSSADLALLFAVTIGFVAHSTTAEKNEADVAIIVDAIPIGNQAWQPNDAYKQERYDFVEAIVGSLFSDPDLDITVAVGLLFEFLDDVKKANFSKEKNYILDAIGGLVKNIEHKHQDRTQKWDNVMNYVKTRVSDWPGNRKVVPDLYIWIAPYKTASGNYTGDAALELFNKVHDDLVDVVFVYADFDSGEERKAYMVDDTKTIETIQKAQFGTIEGKVHPIVRKYLESCDQEYSDGDCFYDETRVCFKNRTFQPYDANAPSARYCLAGMKTVPCEKLPDYCDYLCRQEAWEEWSPCNATCGGKSVRSRHRKTAKGQWYKNCVQEEQQCAGPTCGKTTPRPTTSTTKKVGKTLLEKWHIAMIAVSAVAVVALLITIIACYCRKTKPKARAALRHIHPPYGTLGSGSRTPQYRRGGGSYDTRGPTSGAMTDFRRTPSRQPSRSLAPSTTAPTTVVSTGGRRY